MHWNYRLVRYHKYPDSIGLHEVYYNNAGVATGMTQEPCSFASDWSTEDGLENPRTDIIASLEMALKAAREMPILDEPKQWASLRDDKDIDCETE